MILPPSCTQRAGVSLQVISDGTQPNTATFVENYAAGAFASWLVQQGFDQAVSHEPLIRVVPRFWYNPELDSRCSLLPGTLAVIMAIIGSLLTSLVVAREWERGTMEALLATPAGRLEILLGKLIPYFGLGMGSMLLAVATSRILFGLPFLRGSFYCALCGIVRLSACCAGAGIADLYRREEPIPGRPRCRDLGVSASHVSVRVSLRDQQHAPATPNHCDFCRHDIWYRPVQHSAGRGCRDHPCNEHSGNVVIGTVFLTATVKMTVKRLE